MKRSLEKIIPSNPQKEKMLQNIKTQKSGGVMVFKQVSLACLMLMFIVFSSHQEEIIPISSRSSTLVQFNNKIYCSVIGDYELGEKLGVTSLNGTEYDVYKNNIDDKTIILYEETYILYLECEEK